MLLELTIRDQFYLERIDSHSSVVNSQHLNRQRWVCVSGCIGRLVVAIKPYNPMMHEGDTANRTFLSFSRLFTLIVSTKQVFYFQDPNALFMQCCEQRGLPDACLQKCTFNTYSKESVSFSQCLSVIYFILFQLTRMYFRQDACPLAASAEIQFCAAQGRDHRSCCIRNGVTTTLAGDKCLTFCDQRPGNVTLLDYSYVSCYDRFENMKSCFWHDAAERSKKYWS